MVMGPIGGMTVCFATDVIGTFIMPTTGLDSPSVHTQITTAVPIRVLSLKLSLGILNAKPIMSPKREFDTTIRGNGSPAVGNINGRNGVPVPHA